MDTTQMMKRFDDVDVGSLGWTLAGSALALFGLARRSVGGAALALVGAGLVYKGIGGSMGSLLSGDGEQTADEMLDESIDQSFPASDAPAWTATTSVGKL